MAVSCVTGLGVADVHSEGEMQSAVDRLGELQRDFLIQTLCRDIVASKFVVS